MTNLVYTLGVLVLFFSVNAVAQIEDWYWGVAPTRSNIDIESNFDGDPESVTAGGVGFNFGYAFDSQFLLDFSTTGVGTFSWFGGNDRYELWHSDLTLGYRIKLDRFGVVPKVGFAHWKFDSDEGQFLNPGPEDGDEESGTDTLFGITFDYEVNDRFAIAASHKSVSTDVGRHGFWSFHFIFDI